MKLDRARELFDELLEGGHNFGVEPVIVNETLEARIVVPLGSIEGRHIFARIAEEAKRFDCEVSYVDGRLYYR